MLLLKSNGSDALRILLIAVFSSRVTKHRLKCMTCRENGVRVEP
jgi:hypothetical protein